MTATAAIKFTQGSNTAPAGQALMGVVGAAVASNGNDSGVATWTWTWIDVPPTSAIPLGVAGSGSSLNFSPDVPGGYQLQLATVGTDGTTATDVRCFGVPQASGRFIPPFSGDSSSLNFGGVKTGWSPIMRVWLAFLDALTSSANATSIQGTAVNATAPTVAGQSLVYDGSSQYVARKLTPDDLGPAFNPTISMASGGNGPYELGDTWTPRLNGSPEPNATGVTAYLVNDNQGGTSVSRLGSSGNFAGPSSTYSLSAYGTASLTATVTQSGVTKTTSAQSAAFGQKIWSGVGTAGATGFNGSTGALAGATGTLSGSGVSSGGTESFSVSPSNQKVYYACDTACGTRTFKDAVGFGVSMTQSTVTVVNSKGVSRSFYLYESVQLLSSVSNPITAS